MDAAALSPSTPHALALHLAAASQQPFDWRTNHCGHPIGRWVLAATGRDPLRTLPPCGNAIGWARAVRRAGGMAALVSRCLGCAPVAPAWAQIGDVVLLPGPVTGGTLGICAGRTAVCVDELGASVHVEMTLAEHAWRLSEVTA